MPEFGTPSPLINWGQAPTLDWALCALILGVALLFRPWLPLRHGPMISPWLGSLVLLPLLWATDRLLPAGMTMHVSSACLMTLMFGWPLAMWSLVPAALAAAWLGPGQPLPIGEVVSHLVWLGLLPGTLGLLVGLMIRRWLPHHIFVFILGRAFLGSIVAVAITGALAWLAGRKPDVLGTLEWMIGYTLVAWGEGFSTGMFIAIFVAFKPEWVLTYSDARYLPRKPPRTGPPRSGER
jgi:uncharacterized membrane protein